jgi:hypothetical protein
VEHFGMPVDPGNLMLIGNAAVCRSLVRPVDAPEGKCGSTVLMIARRPAGVSLTSPAWASADC